MLGSIVLVEKILPSPDPDILVSGMIGAVRQLGLACLPWSEAATGFRGRVAFLKRTMPELAWPDFDDAPSGSKPWGRLALAKLRTNDVPGAESAFLEAMKTSDLRSGEPFRENYLLAVSQAKQGRVAEAQATFDAAERQNWQMFVANSVVHVARKEAQMAIKSSSR